MACWWLTIAENCFRRKRPPISHASFAAGQVISGGWDRQLRLWDSRGLPTTTPLSTALLPERVYSMSLQGHRLVVAMAGRHVWVFDLRQMPHPEQRRESSLKYQTKCVRLYPDATGYALSSVEGRVAMEYFDTSDAGQANKYAFKCHRKVEEGRDTVYPVPSLAFHPLSALSATSYLRRALDARSRLTLWVLVGVQVRHVRHRGVRRAGELVGWEQQEAAVPVQQVPHQHRRAGIQPRWEPAGRGL